MSEGLNEHGIPEPVNLIKPGLRIGMADWLTQTFTDPEFSLLDDHGSAYIVYTNKVYLK